MSSFLPLNSLAHSFFVGPTVINNMNVRGAIKTNTQIDCRGAGGGGCAAGSGGAGRFLLRTSTVVPLLRVKRLSISFRLVVATPNL
jgi:hypothetical protein